MGCQISTLRSSLVCITAFFMSLALKHVKTIRFGTSLGMFLLVQSTPQNRAEDMESNS